MVPDPCARIAGSTARMPKKTPLKLMSAACAQARGSAVASGPIGSMTPALLISASMRPKASCARPTAACTWLHSATSQVIASAWAHAADINFKGVFFGIRAVLPGMRAQGSGTIVNLASRAAHTPLEGWSHYCAANAATDMLTRCTHLENRGRGIRVFSLWPGTVATDMQRAIRASGINPVSQMDFASHAPVDEPARALVWLLTEDAASFAGQEVSLRDPDIRARVGLTK